jgi:hypothetical protein
MLDAQGIWAHDAFFDYVDRWMTEDDTPFLPVILECTGEDYSGGWARQGQAWDDFVEEMWAELRGST